MIFKGYSRFVPSLWCWQICLTGSGLCNFKLLILLCIVLSELFLLLPQLQLSFLKTHHLAVSIYSTKSSDSKQNLVSIKHTEETQKKKNPYLRLFHDLDTEHMVLHGIDNYKNITKFCWNYSSSIISSMLWPDNVYFIIS